MAIVITIPKDEHKRLRGIEESYKALQKAYETLVERTVANAVRPPVIEPSEAEKNKRELAQLKESVQFLRTGNDQLRQVLIYIVDNVI